jgi:hypothetical protein
MATLSFMRFPCAIDKEDGGDDAGSAAGFS